MTSYEIVRLTSLYNTLMYIVIDKYSKNERDIFMNENNIAFTIEFFVLYDRSNIIQFIEFKDGK